MQKTRLSFTAIKNSKFTFYFLAIERPIRNIYDISFSMISNANLIESVPEFAYLFKILSGERYFLGDEGNHFG